MNELTDRDRLLVAGEKGREDGGRHCTLMERWSQGQREMERKCQMEKLRPLTSEAGSAGGLPQKRLLRAMPACSMFPVFPNTRP